MKPSHFIFLFSFLFFASVNVAKAADTASTGNWSSSSTWQSGTSPGNGNVLVVPAGVTVTVDCNCGTYSNMHIIVFGTLHFPNGKKINMTADGLADIYTGGTVTGGNGGSKLNIGGTTVWDGGDPDIVGPSSCDGSGCGSNPTLPVELLFFDALAMDEEQVSFHWATATETNNDFFTIEQSADFEVWNIIAIEDGALNSADKVEYELTIGADPLETHPYFRLSQTDVDGAPEVVSEIVLRPAKARINEDDFFSNDGLGGILIHKGLSIGTEIQVVDVQGRAVQSFRYDDPSSDLTVKVTESGIYSVVAIHPTGNVRAEKFAVTIP